MKNGAFEGRGTSNHCCAASFKLGWRGLILRWQDLLNADVINELLAPDVVQMGSFLVVGEVRSDAIRHSKYDGAVAHIQPEGAADELAVSISCKWTVWVCAEIRRVVLLHGCDPS